MWLMALNTAKEYSSDQVSFCGEREREREHREINKQVKTSMLHKTSLWKTESRGARRKDGGQRGRGIALTQMRTPGTKSH